MPRGTDRTADAHERNHLARPQLNVDTRFARHYGKLRRIAQHRLRHEIPSVTLQATSLVHDAFIRYLAGASASDTRQFVRWLDYLMRIGLIERARRRSAAQRGPKWHRIPLTADVLIQAASRPTTCAQDVGQALQTLAKADPRKAKLVRLRFLEGHTVGEAAEALGISVTQAEKDWRVARAFLEAFLQE